MRGIFLIAVLVAVLGICVSGFCESPVLDKAWSCYLKSDYRKALDACRAISRKNILGEKGRYLMGLSFLKLGRQEQARENFEFVLKNYPNTRIRQELLLGIGDSYFLEGNFSQAERYYKQLLGSYSPSDYASMAYLNLGRALRRQGKWKEAQDSFNKVVSVYPASLEVREAKRYLLKDSFFSVQVGAFSKRENALNLRELLIRRGYNARIDKYYDKESLLYKVKVGKFDKKPAAEREAKRLKKDGFAPRVVN